MSPNTSRANGPMRATGVPGGAPTMNPRQNYTTYLRKKHEDISRYPVRRRRHPPVAPVPRGLAEAIAALGQRQDHVAGHGTAPERPAGTDAAADHLRQ